MDGQLAAYRADAARQPCCARRAPPSFPPCHCTPSLPDLPPPHGCPAFPQADVVHLPDPRGADYAHHRGPRVVQGEPGGSLPGGLGGAWAGACRAGSRCQVGAHTGRLCPVISGQRGDKLSCLCHFRHSAALPAMPLMGLAFPPRCLQSKVGPLGACVAREGSWCNYISVPNTPEGKRPARAALAWAARAQHSASSCTASCTAWPACAPPARSAHSAVRALRPAVLITEDASEDARFAANPYVAGDPHIKFYAGAPLVGRSECDSMDMCVWVGGVGWGGRRGPWGLRCGCQGGRPGSNLLQPMHPAYAGAVPLQAAGVGRFTGTRPPPPPLCAPLRRRPALRHTLRGRPQAPLLQRRDVQVGGCAACWVATRRQHPLLLA